MSRRTGMVVDVKSIDTFSDNLEALGKSAKVGAYRGVFAAGLQAFETSKELAPKKSGALVNSAYLRVTEQGSGSFGGRLRDTTTAMIGYTARHAIPKHETPGPKWKYLEKALIELSPKYVNILESYMDFALASTRMKIQKRISHRLRR